ncbi:MAG TPA: hypothetical protein VKA49_01360 [Flavitalea sp.]|nr:hypothetical protein [Flavitalea sp.]
MKKLFLITRLFFSIFIQASRKIAYQPQTAQLPGFSTSLNQQQNFVRGLHTFLFRKLVTAI